MILDLSIESDRSRAETYLSKLIKDGSKIELKKLASPRSVKQNRYLHVLFQLWGTHFGYTLEEAKIAVKIALGYGYEKNGFTFTVKTSGMSDKELSEFINKFRNWSASGGCYLPSSEEYLLRHFNYSKEVERAEIIEKRYGY